MIITNNCPYDADKDAVEIIRNNPIDNGAVAHCFGGNYETVKSYLDVGVQYFGIGGRITYGEKGLMEAVKKMPEESILLETDAPYIKLNGDPKPNTSLALFDIAKKIAEIRGCSTEHIIETSYVNGMRLLL